MSRIGLALSGGGYRATIYHLGVLRFLRDAGLLSRVSHITSVSGGSIMAAHLVLHWDRYTGTEEEFDAATEELLTFIRQDVRNRIVRRYPLALLANLGGWLMRQGWSRRLTRPGLLEVHYERLLFGDKCLYELPAHPQLHMLATNVNEGCLCSFTRNGILEEQRAEVGKTRFTTTPSSMATIPMAVAASSAFPGFFPPIQLTAEDVGASEGRFPPHVLTDGGVYDNLGVRMFRHIQNSWIGHDSPLVADDFVDPDATVSQLASRLNGGDATSPYTQLAQLLVKRSRRRPTASAALTVENLPGRLWDVIVHEKLYQLPDWIGLTLEDDQARELLHLAQSRELERGDHLWLNRCLVNAASQVDGGPRMLHANHTQFETVIVSDAGKEFYISRTTSSGGLVGTAIRASDILMDRVWKLEVDHFGTDADFVFVPISDVVDLSEDPTALHPELQRQVAVMRTDLDRFSDLEISGLTRHGYGLMRKVCRARPDLFGDDLPVGAPWDPTPVAAQEEIRNRRSLNPITQQARQLQGSSRRRVFGKLLSWRDWPTYVYVPLLLLLLVGLPYLAYRSYRIAHRSEQIVDAITFSNPDFQTVLQLVRSNPIPGNWSSLPLDEVSQLEPVDNQGFVLVTDTRILDLRAWKPGSMEDDERVVSYRRMRLRRKLNDPGSAGSEAESRSPTDDQFRFQQSRPDPQIEVRCDSMKLSPHFRVAPTILGEGQRGIIAEAGFDLSSVPDDATVDIGFEIMSPGLQGEDNQLPILQFPIVAETKIASMWILLPEGRPYDRFELLAFDVASGNLVKSVEPTYSFDMADGTVFGWMVVDPSQQYLYECRWEYR